MENNTKKVEQLDPAGRLEGMTLPCGWFVKEKIAVGRHAGGQRSGANFSVGYIVEKNRQCAFLKAVDMQPALREAPNMMQALQRLVDEFIFEQSLHELCLEKKMRRIVKTLSSGEVEVPYVDGDSHNRVPYLVLELAERGDIRSWVTKSALDETSNKFSHLRDVVTGMQQLHQAQVAHQDIKPSNVMVFEKDGAKLGDLGRATWNGTKSWHDHGVAGDLGYAPPEQLYAYELKEWIDRRARCDLYQFGSLMTFLFTGVTLNSFLMERIPSDVLPSVWGGQGQSYLQALPYWTEAFNSTLIMLEEQEFPGWAAPKMIELLKKCSNPEYSKRGAAKSAQNFSVNLGLNRIVSTLDLLSKQANVKARAAVQD